MASTPIIQFSHANGFPGSSYRYLFEQLPGYRVACVEKMGHGDIPLRFDPGNEEFLYRYAAELISGIEQHERGTVIGVGHSAGAVVTLLAAALRPDLFSHVVLLDPVVFSPWRRLLLQCVRWLGLSDRITPAGRAARRRSVFPDRAAARAYFAAKPLFRDFHPRCFDDYLTHGLVDTESGVELAIDPAIEAEVFRNILLRVPKALKQVEGTLIYGCHSHLFGQPERRWWQRQPGMTLIGFDGGHLFPLEQPDETAALLRSILDARLVREQSVSKPAAEA